MFTESLGSPATTVSESEDKHAATREREGSGLGWTAYIYIEGLAERRTLLRDSVITKSGRAIL